MTLLWIIIVLLLLFALSIVILPLVKNRTLKLSSYSRADKLLLLLLALFIPAMGLLIYWNIGTAKLYAESLQAQQRSALIKGEIARLGSTQKIIDTLEQRLSQNPTSVKGWFLLGRLYLTDHQYDRSVNAFRMANKLEPNNAETMVQLAQVLYLQQQQKLSKEATELLNKVLKQQPDNINALNLLGINAMQNHQPQKAIEYWQRILQIIDPGSEDAAIIRTMIEQAKK